VAILSGGPPCRGDVTTQFRAVTRCAGVEDRYGIPRPPQIAARRAERRVARNDIGGGTIKATPFTSRIKAHALDEKRLVRPSAISRSTRSRTMLGRCPRRVRGHQDDSGETANRPPIPPRNAFVAHKRIPRYSSHTRFARAET